MMRLNRWSGGTKFLQRAVLSRLAIFTEGELTRQARFANEETNA